MQHETPLRSSTRGENETDRADLMSAAVTPDFSASTRDGYRYTPVAHSLGYIHADL